LRVSGRWTRIRVVSRVREQVIRLTKTVRGSVSKKVRKLIKTSEIDGRGSDIPRKRVRTA
jgi:hypothetical protein